MNTMGKKEILGGLILLALVLLYGCSQSLTKVSHDPLNGVEDNQGWDYGY